MIQSGGKRLYEHTIGNLEFTICSTAFTNIWYFKGFTLNSSIWASANLPSESIFMVEIRAAAGVAAIT
jgi:hypothetical protein